MLFIMSGSLGVRNKYLNYSNSHNNLDNTFLVDVFSTILGPYFLHVFIILMEVQNCAWKFLSSFIIGNSTEVNKYFDKAYIINPSK